MINKNTDNNKLDLMGILREANEGNSKIESIIEAYLEVEGSNLTLLIRFIEKVNKEDRAVIAAEIGSTIMKTITNDSKSIPMLKIKILN